MELLVGVLGGALFSWLFSHLYYRRAATRSRQDVRKEVLADELTALSRRLAAILDEYFDRNGLSNEHKRSLLETHSQEIAETLGHHAGFVTEMLRDHRAEVDCSSAKSLNASLGRLWAKHW